jgi:zinc transporter ZupT
MTILNYIIAITLTLGWIIGYFVFNTGKDIHLLFGMAVMASSVIIVGKKDRERNALI